MKQNKSFLRTSMLLPVFILALFLSGIVAFAEIQILPTDVSTPSEGCIFLGLQGRFNYDASAFLARVNEIRLEACQEGVLDPSDPDKTRVLTIDDYVPLKWSGELEYCARIRTVEAMVTMGHTRANGNTLIMNGPNNQTFDFTGKEGLAWNNQQGMMEGINLWYSKKADWVNQTANAKTGPYEAMINPEYRYVGIGLFNGNYSNNSSSDTTYRNCTAAVYTTIETGLSETPLSPTGECIQTIEVAKSHCSGGQISGIVNGPKGTTSSLILKANVRYTDDNYTYSSRLLIPDTASVTWGSSSPNIVSVDSNGVATANYCGSAYINASYENISARAQYQVAHNYVQIPEVPATCTQSGTTAGIQCSVCNKVNSGLQTINPIGHSWKESVYSWSEDYTSATASRTCNNDPEHEETETVNASSEITLQPTCETGGETTYTAVFENEAFTTQTKTLQNINATGHDWKLESWSWEDDLSKATAAFSCRKDSSHTLPKQALITIDTTPETCETAGSKRYTATAAVGEDTYTDTRTVTIPATGHDWNNWTVTREATYEAEGEEQRTCRNNASHVEKRSIPKRVKTEDTSTTQPAGGSSGTSPTTSSSTTPSTSAPANTTASTNTTSPSNTAASSNSSAAKPQAVPTNSSAAKPQAALSGQASSVGSKKDGVALTPETEVNEAAAPTAKAQEKTILAQKSDNDPEGSTYGLLQAQMKKVTKNSITLKWKKINGAKYVIYGNKCGKKNKYKILKTVKGTSFTQKKLKEGTYYKYLVVAVKNGKAIATSKTIHVATTGGKVGNTKSVKAAKKTLSLKVGSTARIKVTTKAANKKLKVKSHRKIAYESSNTNIATVVTKTGDVKGVRSGTCYVYAYAQDGVMAKIKVTVG